MRKLSFLDYGWVAFVLFTAIFILPDHVPIYEVENCEVFTEDCTPESPQKILVNTAPPEMSHYFEPSKPKVLRPVYSDYQIAMWLLKRNESLRLEPYWDVSQWTVGWGTKTDDKNEKINLEEANKRTREHFQKLLEGIQKDYPHLDKFTQLVLTQFVYNVGSIKKNSGLDKAIKSGDIQRICENMLKYINAGGEPHKGLKLRRQREIQLLKASPEERQMLAEKYKNRVLEIIRENNL